MSTELVVLGSGGFSPEAGSPPGAVRNPAGYALRRGGEILLFDLGFGDFRQLVRAGLDPAAVTHAFFTHRHPDHVGDLPALLFHYRFEAPPSSGRLSVLGPRGFCPFFERLSRAHGPWLGPRGYRLSVRELEEGAFVRGPGWSVAARETSHSTEAVAYRFESREATVVYTGDTGPDPGLASFARGADLFILECSLPDAARDAGHLRVAEAVALLKASGARRGLLSHLSRASARGLARRLAGLRARPAEDLMRVRL